MTQRVTRKWDLLVRGGLQRLDYQSILSATAGPARIDRIDQYRWRNRLRLDRSVRIGLNAIEVERHTNTPALPGYSGLRIGISVDYGLNQ